jgi:hypothetical protein
MVPSMKGAEKLIGYYYYDYADSTGTHHLRKFSQATELIKTATGSDGRVDVLYLDDSPEESSLVLEVKPWWVFVFGTALVVLAVGIVIFAIKLVPADFWTKAKPASNKKKGATGKGKRA